MIMYKKEVFDDKLIFRFEGKIDTFQATELEKELKVDLENNTRIIEFDLKDVDFISSGFLRLCLMSSIKVGNDNFYILNPKSAVMNIFRLTGFDRNFNFRFE